MNDVPPVSIVTDGTAAGAATTHDVRTALAEHVEDCRRRLLIRLRDTHAGTLVAPYFERGKMLRAFLVFAASAAVGGDPSRGVAAAQTIELLHAASLFHDDVIDGADERRGIAALHRRVSTEGAIVLGDLLLMQAFSVLCEAQAVAAEDSLIEALSLLAAHAQACCRGQLSELELTGRMVCEDDYFAIVQGKTASPFVAAAGLGAVLGGASARERRALETFARHLGVAFQVCDDMLDVTAGHAALGKPAGNSLARSRPMLPVIYLERYGSPAARLAWKSLQGSAEAAAERRVLLRQEGIDRYVADTQQEFVAAALAALDALPASDVIQALRELTAIVERW